MSVASLPPHESRPPTRTMSALVWFFRTLLPVGAFMGAGILLVVGIGLAERLGFLRAPDDSRTAANDGATVYTCPMHPQIRQPGPGRCPICGMALVPAASGAADLDEFSV